MKHIDIDLTQYKSLLKAKFRENGVELWDIIRKKYVVISPEEVVRQLFILYLSESGRTNLNRISVEKKIKVFNRLHRYDIIVHDSTGDPLVLIECKSHEVTLTPKVLSQIGQYNRVVAAPYLIISNGIYTYCLKRNPASMTYDFLEEIPCFTPE
jgi:hypothetical protein